MIDFEIIYHYFKIRLYVHNILYIQKKSIISTVSEQVLQYPNFSQFKTTNGKLLFLKDIAMKITIPSKYKYLNYNNIFNLCKTFLLFFFFIGRKTYKLFL